MHVHQYTNSLSLSWFFSAPLCYILITSIYIYLSVTSELENKLTKTEICVLVTEYLGTDFEIHIKHISVCVRPKWTHKLELDLSVF